MLPRAGRTADASSRRMAGAASGAGPNGSSSSGAAAAAAVGRPGAGPAGRRAALLERFAHEPHNWRCADCQAIMPRNVVLSAVGAFVCSDCAGLHREQGRRVKGLTSSTFTPEEASFVLEHGGNERVRRRLGGGGRRAGGDQIGSSRASSSSSSAASLLPAYLQSHWSVEQKRGWMRDKYGDSHVASGASDVARAAAADEGDGGGERQAWRAEQDVFVSEWPDEDRERREPATTMTTAAPSSSAQHGAGALRALHADVDDEADGEGWATSDSWM